MARDFFYYFCYNLYMRKELKKYFKYATWLFFGSAIFGFIVANLSLNEARSLIEELSEGLSFAKDLSFLPLFLFIFFFNSVTSFLAVVLGTLFGLYPLFVVFLNGQILGVVIAVFLPEMGILKILGSLVPHGIFEIPAFLFAASLGIYLGEKFYISQNEKKEFKKYFKKSVLKFSKIVLPMLLLAALIETALIIFWPNKL